METEVLQALKPTAWYKALFYVASTVLLVSIPANQTNIAIVAVGAAVFGLGEWINHPRRVELTPKLKVTTSSRLHSSFGLMVDAIGIALMLFGTGRMLEIW